MLVYLKSKRNFYNGNALDFSLEQAIAKCGGNQKHYNFFKELLSSSIWNTTTNLPMHDTRAGQALLFLYPINIRIFLSLVLYKEELNIIEDYDEFEFRLDLNTPKQQLILNSIIDKIQLSKKIFSALDNLSEDFILNDQHLRDLKLLLNIQTPLSFEARTLRENVQRVFNVFNNNSSFNEKVIEIMYTNNRLEAASVAANALQFRTAGINLLLQTVEKWQNQPFVI